MLFKTLSVAVIAALLTSGVVYYGSTDIGNAAEIQVADQTNDKASAPDWLRGLTERLSSPVAEVNKDGTQQTADKKAAPHPNDEIVRYYKFVDGEFTEIEYLPSRIFTPDSVNADATFRISASRKQALNITDFNLRDRAYLGIVEYAIAEGMFSEAEDAMAQIGQVPLRDTARSRIALAYASLGDTDAAFKQIDAVEVDELRDVMRLQVIEVLIATEPPENMASQ